MAKINANYQKLQASYLFSEIAKRVRAFSEKNPSARVIRLGIGDVVLPLPAPIVDERKDAKIGIIGYGTSHWAIGESRDQLREETNVETSYFRVRAYPFTEELGAFIDAHDRIYIVEQNRDAQRLLLMKLELSPDRVAKLRSVLHYNGLPIDARSISDDLLAQEGFEVAKRVGPSSPSSMTGGE